MISQMVVILGGGISGLSAAYYAAQKLPGIPIHLVEATNRLGGWVQTTRTRDGLVLEHGPRTIRPSGDNGANTLNLIEELGLQEKAQPISRSHPAAKNRMIYAKGALHTLPSSLGALFRTCAPLTRPLAAVVLTDMRAPTTLCSDESSYDFIARRLGSDVADYLISPLLCGVCAGDAHNISVKMLFKSLFEAEQNYGSIFIGMLKKILREKSSTNHITLSNLAKKARTEKWSVYSLSNGLQTLPEALENKLRTFNNVKLHVNDCCTALSISKDKVKIQLKSGIVLDTQRVISALPAAKLATLVEKEHPLLKNILSQIPFATVGVINIHYKDNVLREPAFGFLVPPRENLPLLGVVYDSVCFPNKFNDTILTAMMGGHWYHPQFTNLTEEQLAKVAIDCIAMVLNVIIQPTAVKVSVQKDCIPQYTVGHYERLDQIKLYIKSNKLPLYLIGSSYNGIGLNDVIMSAKQAVGDIS